MKEVDFREAVVGEAVSMKAVASGEAVVGGSTVIGFTSGVVKVIIHYIKLEGMLMQIKTFKAM